MEKTIMSQSCVMSLISTNLIRGRFLFKSKPWSRRLMVAAKSVSCTYKPVRGLLSLTNSITGLNFVNQTGEPEIQFPGSEEELPSWPSRGPDWTPLEVPELPNIPEIKPSETPPEVTTVPSDPPPLGQPQTPGPEFPVPPSPSPPMPNTPNPPTPERPPDVVPPNWEPPRPPDIFPPEMPPPGIEPPSPMEPTII